MARALSAHERDVLLQLETMGWSRRILRARGRNATIFTHLERLLAAGLVERRRALAHETYTAELYCYRLTSAGERQCEVWGLA